MLKIPVFIVAISIVLPALAEDTEISVARGETVSIVAACQDCHSKGYPEAQGVIDPATAMKGKDVGYQGPWGTSYPANLRLTVASMTEDQWVTHLKTFKAAPPMPWFNVHRMSEYETRSLYQYIASLGEPGEPAPPLVPTGQAPRHPFVVMVPPVMPAP